MVTNSNCSFYRYSSFMLCLFWIKKPKCQVHAAKAKSCTEPCAPCAAVGGTSRGPSWDLQQVASPSCGKQLLFEKHNSTSDNIVANIYSILHVKLFFGEIWRFMATEEELCKVWWYMVARMFLFSSVCSKGVLKSNFRQYGQMRSRDGKSQKRREEERRSRCAKR